MSDVENSSSESEIKGIYRNEMMRNPAKAKAVVEITDILEKHLIEKDSAEAIYQLLYGGTKGELQKHIKKTNKREKKKEEKFVAEGINKPKNAHQMFSIKFAEQCKAGGVKFTLQGMNIAWKNFPDKEKAKLIAEAKRLSDEYEAETARQKKAAVKSGKIAEDKPKAPQTAYFLFMNDKREEISNDEELLSKYETGKDGKPASKVTRVSMAGGDLWKALSEKEKTKYETAYKKAKAKHAEELKAWAEREKERRKKNGEAFDDVEVETDGKAAGPAESEPEEPKPKEKKAKKPTKAKESETEASEAEPEAKPEPKSEAKPVKEKKPKATKAKKAASDAEDN